MSPEIYNQAKNIFLIFPPGCGGNHLANMLSLHPDFEPRYKTDGDYVSEIIESYKKQLLPKRVKQFWKGDSAVHFSELENLQPDHFERYKDNVVNSDKKYLFCSHAYEYYNARKTIPLISKLKNKIFLLFTCPSRRNMIAFLRWSAGPWALGEPKINAFNMRDNPDNLYSVNALSSAIKVSSDNILLINTDEFYTENGMDYVDKLLMENCGINLTSHCRELHQIYINEKVNIYGSMIP
jgi:hypothetical protein